MESVGELAQVAKIVQQEKSHAAADRFVGTLIRNKRLAVHSYSSDAILLEYASELDREWGFGCWDVLYGALLRERKWKQKTQFVY